MLEDGRLRGVRRDGKDRMRVFTFVLAGGPVRLDWLDRSVVVNAAGQDVRRCFGDG